MSRRGVAPTEEDAGDGRRWHIPPPVLGLTGFTGPEGTVILEEIEDPLGPLLWRVFRGVATWSAGPPNESDTGPVDRPRSGWAGSLDPSAAPAELREPLSFLSALNGDDAAVGSALQTVARWATAAGHDRTGAEFHQLAATVCPSDSVTALRAGQATRRLADYSRSEIWLQRAIGLARREEDWRTYTESFIELGTMLRRRGSIPAARRHFQRAYRRAVRAGLRDLRAKAAHDLFVIETELSNREAAGRWAIEALRTYPTDDVNIPRVAFDLAFLWMADGLHDAALRVFTKVEPLVEGPGKMVVWGGIARAAGGAGSHEMFVRAYDELSRAESTAGLADAWLELARGARLLGRLDDATAAAGVSVEIARARRERKIELQAEELLVQLAMTESGDSVDTVSDDGEPREPMIEEVMHVLLQTA